MPVTPGTYIIGYGEQPHNVEKPHILTSKGEGKQLTVEPITDELNQQWRIELPSGAEKDSKDRIIRPVTEALTTGKEILAVSQDAVLSPDEVSLIKNLQVWTFEPVREDHGILIYEIRSNFYNGLDGSDPLLGVDKDIKKVIIQSIPDNSDSSKRPIWQLMGPIDDP